MKEHKKFTKIGKLSTAVNTLKHQLQFIDLTEDGTAIYDRGIELPTIELHGTVKVHGTNAAVQQLPDGTLLYQSRSKYVTLEDDNCGFASWAYTHHDQLLEVLKHYRAVFSVGDNSILTIFGEWAGTGVQPTVAISQHAKSFYIFSALESQGLTDRYLDMTSIGHVDNPDVNIYNLWNTDMFPVFRAQLDLDNPKLVQNHLISLTDKVEEECPVAKYFGYSGIGEGIVWINNEYEFRVKIKGDKHAGKSKVYKTNIVDLEKLTTVDAFVERFVDIERLEQGYAMMTELGHTNEPVTVPAFIRWVIGDVNTEESDTLQASNLTPKDVNPAISKKAAKWYIRRLEQL